MRDVINIAVVDDLPQDRNKMQSLLLQYARKQNLNWQVTLFADGKDFLDSLSQNTYAIVFLDIVMEGIDGIETARRMRKTCPDTLLVFVTTEEDYAVEGYEVEAVGFLVIGESSQGKRFDRLMQRLTEKLRQDEVLEVSENNISLQIPLGQIFYIEVLGHNMLLHARDGNHALRMTMAEIKALLPEDGRFFECHRGIVVNLDRVTDLGSQTITMENGDTLPVSRRKRTELDQAYAARSIARVRGMI